MTSNISNRHPVDQLSDVREEIKILQGKESHLRAVLIEEGANLSGGENYARITTNKQKRLDRKKLEAKFGVKAIEDCFTEQSITMIKIIQREADAA